MKRLFSVFIVVFCALGTIGASSPTTTPPSEASSKRTSTVLKPGEELMYKVSYGFITLGYIKLTTEKQTTYNNREVAVAKANLKSADGIPFVDLNVVFRSWMSPSTQYSHKFYAAEKQDESTWEVEEYFFEYPKDYIGLRTRVKNNVSDTNTIGTSEYWSDGLSLLYLAREFANTKRNVRIPTMIMGDTARTIINFRNEQEAVEIDAVDYEVDALVLDGKALWEGVYGMKGDFVGWFSNDEARVPIRAELEVYVGDVTLELISWKRDGWSPPRKR